MRKGSPLNVPDVADAAAKNLATSGYLKQISK